MRSRGVFLVAWAVASAVTVQGGRPFESVNRALENVTFTFDTSAQGDISAQGPADVTVYIRLPQGVHCKGFGVDDVVVRGEMQGTRQVDNKELQRYDFEVQAKGVLFSCNVPLCIKTSLPLNDWECSGAISVFSNKESNTSVKFRQMVLSADFSRQLPSRSEHVKMECADQVFMDGLHFAGHDLKKILGVDITPLVINALEGSGKAQAVGPIRSAVCAALGDAGSDLGKQIVSGPLRDMLAVNPPFRELVWMENELSKTLPQGVALVDFNDNVFTSLLSLGGKLDSVPIPVSLLEQATGIALTGSLSLPFLETVIGSRLPRAGNESGNEINLLESLALVFGKGPVEESRNISYSLPDVGSFWARIQSLSLDIGFSSDPAILELSLVGKQTIGLPAIKIDRLNLKASVTAHIDVNASLVGGQRVILSVEDTFDASMQADKLAASLALLLALNSDTISSLQLGPLGEHIVDCALSALHVAPALADLDLRIGSLSAHLGGFSTGLAGLAGQLFNTAMPVFQGAIPKAVSAYVANFTRGRPLLDRLPECPQNSSSGKDGVLYNFAQGVVGAVSSKVSPQVVNELLATAPASIAKGPSIEFGLPHIGGISAQTLKVSVEQIELHTPRVRTLDFLQAQEWFSNANANANASASTGWLVHNRIAADAMFLAAQVRIESLTPTSLRPTPSRSEPELVAPGHVNLIHLNLSTTSVEAALDVVVAILASDIWSTTLGQIPSLDCWIGKLRAPDGGAHNSSISLDHFDVTLACETCDSLLFRQISDRMHVADARKHLFDNLKGLLDRWLLLVRSLFSANRWQSTIDSAKARCAARAGAFLQNSVPMTQEIGNLVSDDSAAELLLGGLAIMLAAFGTLVSILPDQHHKSKGLEDAGANVGEPLFRNPRIPVTFRAAMPFLLAINLGCFVYGHIGYVIRITVIGTLLGGELKVDDLPQYSVVTSTQELWQGGAVALALIITVFSIIWPYVKLIFLALCWFSPLDKLRFRTRGRILYGLDVVGKWSMIELFIVAFVLIFLNIPIKGPDATLDFLPPDLVTFRLAVIPQTNLYTFIAALLLSLGLSSAAATYHEILADEHTLSERVYRAEPASLVDVVLGDMGMVGSDHRLKANYAVLASLAVASIVTMLAASLKVLHIEILGLVGRAMDMGGSSAVNEYSLLSFVAHSMVPGTPFGQTFLALVIFLVALMVPLAQLGLLAFLVWPGTKLSLEHALRCRILNQVLSAFCALEVFLVGVGVSVLELGMLTRTLLADQCDGALPFIKGVLLPMDLVSLRDAQAGCFALDATLKPSTRLFLFAVFLANLLNLVIVRIALERFITRASETSDFEGQSLQGQSLQGQSLQGQSGQSLEANMHAPLLRIEPDIEFDQVELEMSRSSSLR